MNFRRVALVACFVVGAFVGCSGKLKQGERCGDGIGFGECDDGLICDDKANWTCQPRSKYDPPPLPDAGPPDADSSDGASDASGDASADD